MFTCPVHAGGGAGGGGAGGSGQEPGGFGTLLQPQPFFPFSHAVVGPHEARSCPGAQNLEDQETESEYPSSFDMPRKSAKGLPALSCTTCGRSTYAFFQTLPFARFWLGPKAPIVKLDQVKPSRDQA